MRKEKKKINKEVQKKIDNNSDNNSVVWDWVVPVWNTSHSLTRNLLRQRDKKKNLILKTRKQKKKETVSKKE
jgi:hypothetical protein